MSTLKESIITKYTELIRDNPEWAQQMASICKLGSYFIAGSFGQSFLYYELIQAASNCVSLLNKTVIRQPRPQERTSKEKLELALSFIEYLEAFVELYASRKFGAKSKTRLIWFVQITKCTFRMILLLHYKSGIQPLPPCEADDTPMQGSQEVVEEKLPHCQCTVGRVLNVKLTRSGRLLRKLTSSSSHACHQCSESTLDEKTTQRGQSLETKKTVAELVHIFKPIIHLTCLSLTKPNSWFPWLTSAVTDATSIFLTKDAQHVLRPEEKREIERRQTMLFLYLLRTPCYDQWTKRKIIRSLQFVARIIPGGSMLLGPVLDYLDEWQDTYFYLWSN